jgi:hypothetical protein
VLLSQLRYCRHFLMSASYRFRLLPPQQCTFMAVSSPFDRIIGLLLVPLVSVFRDGITIFTLSLLFNDTLLMPFEHATLTFHKYTL